MKLKIIIAAVSFIALFSTVTTIIYATQNTAVTVTLDGKEQTLNTSANNVEEVLKECKVTLGSHDSVSIPLDTEIEKNMNIIWKPAMKVNVDIDGQVTEKWTTEKVVSKFYEQEAITFAEKDKSSVDETVAITDGMTISIQKAFPVTLADNSQASELHTTAKTVGAFLEENAVTLGANDRVEPAATEGLAANATVTIIRQTTGQEIVDLEIPFETVEKTDDTLAKDTTKVETEGSIGVKQQTFDVVYENGVEMSRNLVSEVITKDKVDKVVLVGTYVAPKVQPAAQTKTQTPAQPKTQTTVPTKEQPQEQPTTQTPTPPPATGGDAEKLIQYAKQFQGIRYVYGGSSPSGFDCTGFITYCFKNVQGKTLPRSSSSYRPNLTLAQMQPGDVIIFDNNSDGIPNHAGIYMGGGNFIHSSSYHNVGVIITHISEGNYQKRFMGGVRY